MARLMQMASPVTNTALSASFYAPEYLRVTTHRACPVTSSEGAQRRISPVPVGSRILLL